MKRKSTRKILFMVVLITVISLTVNGQTNVSGGIYSNTTWTLANSPYIVVDTVVVFPNVTLTIEPGVVVKFANNKRLEIRNASIIAQGTSTDSITFTSNSASPIPGIWASIYLNPCHNSSFNYCNFFYAANGIYCNGNLDGIPLKNSTFRYNDVGLGWIYYSTILADSCIFRNNNNGVKWATGRVVMKNSIINNNQNGILSPERSTYIHCVIDSNILIGVSTQQHDSIIDCEIKNNGIGIVVGTSGGSFPSFITRNLIENNNIGIQLENWSANDQIYCNKICNNLNYDLKSTIANNTNCVISNYWCSTDSTIIASHIYDGYDNAGLGLVTFMPIDTSQCYLTGCNLSITANITNATCDTCHDGAATAIVNNGFSPFTYTWFTAPIQTSQTATGLSSGTYVVCVSDANGCSVCDSVFIDSTNCNSFSILTQSINATCNSCNDGIAWVNVIGGTAPYFYTWYTAPIQTTDTASGLLPGTYAVCVTDIYGCSACDSAIVSAGNCSAHFNLYPDTIAHHYYAINMASGVLPLTYSWNWGDGTTNDTVPYPNHTYSTAGFYTICLAITDSVGCTSTYCSSYYLMRSTNTMVYVNVIPQTATGISETFENSYVSIFPNPAGNYLTYTLGQNILIAGIKIFNLFGELEFYSTIRNHNHNIDISTLSNGIHILEITDGKNINRQKFIVQKNIR